MQRDNFGYDFFSYREGMKFLLNHRKVKTLYCFNSSFCIINPLKLFYTFFDVEKTVAHYLSLTGNYEIGYHNQSFLMRFSEELVKDTRFQMWFNNLPILKNKRDIVINYEIGLSKFLMNNNIYIDALYKTFPDQVANPTHFYWLDVVNRFGIAKWELIERNPGNLDISELLNMEICLHDL